MRQRIIAVDNDSIAEELGIKPGFFLLRINGEDVEDVIDYEQLTAETHVTLELETKSGKIVTAEVDKEEYEKILYGYWEAVAAQEGTSYADLFLTEGESAENIASKRVDLIAKYSDAIPVELVTVSDFRTYEVLLSFNGKTISADGYEDFHFVIDNKDDNWKVLQGLSWAAPYPEDPTGD